MKSLWLSILFLSVSFAVAHAQFRYTHTTQTNQSYTPLTGATDMTGGQPWVAVDFSVPIGFPFSFNGRAVTSFNLPMSRYAQPFIAASNNPFDSLFAFLPMDCALWDRANHNPAATAGVSPIRYQTTGATPARIFKVEFFNAGLYEDEYNTDSINFQVWFYEGTQAIEFRYGPRQINPQFLYDYFDPGPGPVIGFANGIDTAFNSAFLYHLVGSPSAPTLDSFDTQNFPTSVLSSFPPVGTVYRFTPAASPAGIDSAGAIATARMLKLYPSVASESIHTEWTGAPGEPYEIITATGQSVARGKLDRGTQRVSITHLPNGMYYLRLAAGAHFFVKR